MSMYLNNDERVKSNMSPHFYFGISICQPRGGHQENLMKTRSYLYNRRRRRQEISRDLDPNPT